jgi:hypothetical protein
MKIFVGAAKGPITFPTWSTSSLAKTIVIQQNDKKTDTLIVTKANMACPVNSSVVPMTVVSAIAYM